MTALSTRWVHLGLERTDWVAGARVLGEGVALVLVLVLVRGAGDIATVPLAYLIGAAVTSLLLLAALRARGLSFPVRVDWATARPVFERSRHLVGFTLLGLLLYNFDLIFLRFVSGPTAAGYYAAAYTLISFAANLTVAFAHTVLPALTRLEAVPAERDELYRTSIAQGFAVTLPAAVGGFVVAAQILDQIFGASYLPGTAAMQWLAWAIPLAALREIPIVALIAAGRESVMLRINAITVVWNVALNVALVPKLGLVGAAAATVVTEVIRLALAMRYTRQAGFDVSGLMRRLWKPVTASAVMLAVLVFLRPSTLWASLALGGATYAVALLAVGGVRVGRGAIPTLRV
jgi:O-antigen/teichoic acid export membrane protein